MKRFITLRRPGRRQVRPAKYRPGLVALEGRLLPSVVYAVDNLGDAGTGSGTSGDFRYCLAHAQSEDSVRFAITGTIDLTRPLPTLNAFLTITGPGADLLTVERNSAGTFRVFNLAAGAVVGISGMTVANGSETMGAAILNNGYLSVSNMVFQGNVATGAGSVGGRGGAIYNNGTLTVTDSVFENNAVVTTSGSAGDAGGAIASASGRTVVISGSTFSDNTITGRSGVDTGGGVSSAGTLIITRTVFANNTVSGNGGAVFSNGTMTVIASTFSTNHASANGGGIYTAGQVVTVGNCLFFGNTAGTSGGGIDNAGTTGNALTVSGTTLTGNSAISGGGIASSVSLTINNSTVTGNTAAGTSSSGTGGGIANSGALTITNTTIAGNSALAGRTGSGLGGGIYTSSSSSAPVNLLSTTIAGNLASNDGGGLYTTNSTSSFVRPRNVLLAGNMATRGPDLFNRIASQGHNLIYDQSFGSGFDSTDLPPLVDPMLDPAGLQSNGGLTQTIALLPGSPAIDAGDSSGVTDFDQRGQGFARIVGGAIDIGAFEVQNANAFTFQVSAPAGAVSGTPFAITVTALDASGAVAAGYTGTVTFSSSDADSGVVLPADYIFTPADGGVHTFTNTGLGETTLITPGDQTITVMDTSVNTILGTATVTVSGAAPRPGPLSPSHAGLESAPSGCPGRDVPPALFAADPNPCFRVPREDDFRFLCSARHGRQSTAAALALDWLYESDPLWM